MSPLVDDKLRHNIANVKVAVEITSHKIVNSRVKMMGKGALRNLMDDEK